MFYVFVLMQCTLAYPLMSSPLEIKYFPLMAKGLGPVLNIAVSGLPWKGAKELDFDGFSQVR